MAVEQALNDGNSVKSLLVVNASETTSTLKVYGNATTHGMLVSIAGSESGVTVTTKLSPVTTETPSNVSVSASNFTVLSSNSNRRGASIFNDGSANVYVKFGATATTSSFRVKLPAGSYFEFPMPVYTGIVDAIGDQATGTLRVTEDV